MTQSKLQKLQRYNSLKRRISYYENMLRKTKKDDKLYSTYEKSLNKFKAQLEDVK